MTVRKHEIPVDLSACAAEPIRIPGAIQPHGVLLALEPRTLIVEAVSANSGAFLGLSPGELIGKSPALFMGERQFADVAAAIASEGFESGVHAIVVGSDPEPMECVASRYRNVVLLELQPASGAFSLDDLDVSLSLQAPLARMERCKNIVELVRVVAKDIRSISGFDRVLIYRFDGDWHGEVIAEDSGDRYPVSLLGLHFPASDIPVQARELYLLNTLRLIPDADYVPVPIVPSEVPRLSGPLDLSRAELRSVSAIHLEYLRNMDVRATLTISIVVHGKLWGLVAAHNATPRRITHAVRSTCNFFAQMLALTIGARTDQSDLSIRLNMSQRIVKYVAGLEPTQSLWEELRRNRSALLRLFDAPALFVRGPEGTELHGTSRSVADVEKAVAALKRIACNGIAHCASLRKLEAEAGRLAPELCGGLYVGLSAADDRCLVFFRRESNVRVLWGGNPNKAAVAQAATGRLSPRTSFAAWEEIKRFESAAWSASDLVKAEILRDQLIAWQQAREQVRLLAHHDPLTQLPNRRLLDERLRCALAEAEAQGKMVALLFIDVDRFKRFNDRLGHAAGDVVLREVGSRTVRAVRDCDIVGRLGGDEFVVILPGLSERGIAHVVAERLVREIAQPIDGFVGPDLRVNVSIGISFFPSDGVTSEALLGRADAAMYRAKEENRSAWLSSQTAQPSLDRFSCENERGVADALARGEIVAHFQPIVELNSGRVVAVEALARWDHETRGVLGPSAFLEAAEQSDLILRLGAHMLDAACSEGRRWRQSGHPDLRVAVNVSPRQLRDFDFVSLVRETLRRHDLPAEALELEITERLMAGDTPQSIDALRELAACGVRIVIDDFGAGYSSFNYLRRLPVSALKIDRTFVADIDVVEARETGMAIVRAIVSLARTLELEVVAEGVETKSELELLRALGCNYAQGHYLGRPQAAEDYPAFTKSAS